MITGESLKQINNELPKVNIKGKQYVMVKDRVAAFRQICPDGSITTEIISADNGSVIMKATVSDGERVLATGMAWEKENSTYINKTSYIENCETSCIGRALGFVGIGVDDSMASAEEVANAIMNQNKSSEKQPDEKVSNEVVTGLKIACEKRGVPESYLSEKFGVKDFSEITVEQYTKYRAKIIEILDRYKDEDARQAG